MRSAKTFLILAAAALFAAADLYAQNNIVANPMDLNYRFATERYYSGGGNSYREAADPVVITYKDKYYLFASKSGGYWSSEDLVHWDYIMSMAFEGPYIEAYAPTVFIYKDEMYYMSSIYVKSKEDRYVIYKTSDPEHDKWEKIDSKLDFGDVDPMVFVDDDGKVYLYSACSNTTPIIAHRLDPEDGFRIVEGPVECIGHNASKYGFEARGDNNELRGEGYNEGATLNKRNGRYYLQYAVNGTQFRSYTDGVYVADSPLGPFTYEHNSPFCLKQGGFVAGTGHGTVFQDRWGNWWRVGSMKLSVREKNERRLGLFPVFFDAQGHMYSPTVWSDYPFCVPQRACDFATEDPGLGTVCLSFGGKMSASSELSEEYAAANAGDEVFETFWAAASGKAGEWCKNDLGKRCRVQFLQVNFADVNAGIAGPDTYIYRYVIEGSKNGKRWFPLVDMSANTKDRPHALFSLDKPVKVRYVRIVNAADCPGNFSLMDLRIFGNAFGKAPEAVGTVVAKREDSERRDIFLDWEAVDGADGYIVRWGVEPERLETARMVREPSFDGKCFNTEDKYYFTVEAFGKGGSGAKSEMLVVE